MRRRWRHGLHGLVGWMLALVLWVWRTTCRLSVECDPRPALRAQNTPYALALLHAQQISAIFANDEPKLAAMVSRSVDGDLLVPSLRLHRVISVRGSTRRGTQDKGGRAALATLGTLLAQNIPVLLAVDGPRGPRGHVHRGIVDLARNSGAVILPVAMVPSRRWICQRAWDRFQLPLPFSHVRMRFGQPIQVAHENVAVEALTAQVKEALRLLEEQIDPSEAAQWQRPPRPA